MEKEIIPINGMPKQTLPFNHVVKAGPLLYLTSQLSCNLITGGLLPGDIQCQTRNALENIKFLLEHASSSLGRVVDVTVYMRNLGDFDGMNRVYREYFTEGEEPARVVVQAGSPLDGIDIEMKVIALAADGAG